MLLATDSTAAAAFVNGIFPKEAVEAAKKQHEMAEKAGISLVDTSKPAEAPAPAPTIPMVEGQVVYPTQPTAPLQ